MLLTKFPAIMAQADISDLFLDNRRGVSELISCSSASARGRKTVVKLVLENNLPGPLSGPSLLCLSKRTVRSWRSPTQQLPDPVHPSRSVSCLPLPSGERDPDLSSKARECHVLMPIYGQRRSSAFFTVYSVELGYEDQWCREGLRRLVRIMGKGRNIVCYQWKKFKLNNRLSLYMIIFSEP